MDDTDKTASSNGVNKGALDTEKCQEQCDIDPENCFAYQIDLSTNSESKCVIFNEKKDMVGNAQSTANCYLYRKTPAELAKKADAAKELAVEKSTKIQHFMTSFTADMGHLQITLESIDAEKQEAAYKCIGAIQKPGDNISASSTYDETFETLKKITDGFIQCITEQKPEKVPINAWCGPPADPNDLNAIAQLTCADRLCCGKAIAASAGEESAIYTCQKIGTTSYSPLKVKGYSQYDATSDWVFQCPEVLEGSKAMLSGLVAVLMAVLIFVA